jgi:hypothetical protein
MSLRIRSEEFMHFLEGSTESRKPMINGEAEDLPISEYDIHNMEMQWFNRIY